MAGRPTFAQIDLAALRHNFAQVRRQLDPGCQVLAVVKADAYGHGAARVAPALEAAGAALFGVAMVEEGEQLREAGVTRPILVFGSCYAGQEELLARLDLTPVVFSLETARRLNRQALADGRTCRYHLKVDTGMGRVGFRPEEMPEVLRALADLPGLEMEGLISHLAVADEPARPFTNTQIERFRAILQQVRDGGFAPRYVHLSNSAAVFSRQLPECNLVRPGISLYGGLPSHHFAGRLDLRPVMQLQSAVAQLKQVPPGTGISYGHRFVAGRPTLVAAVPVGYADGYSRRLTNCGEVLIRGRRAPVAGTVCMDWTLVDVTDVPGVGVGDPVILLGRDGGQQISGEEWADKIGTINYEVFCGISKRVPRVFRG